MRVAMLGGASKMLSMVRDTFMMSVAVNSTRSARPNAAKWRVASCALLKQSNKYAN